MTQNQMTKLGKVYLFLSPLSIFFLVTVEDLYQAMRGTREEERREEKINTTKNFQNKLNIFLSVANRLITMFHN